MNEPIYTEKYKGIKIKVYQDEDALSPDESGDTGLLLVGFHRDFSVEREGFEKDVCINLFHKQYDDDEVPDDEAQFEYAKTRAKEIKEQYHIFGLEAYIHSGVVLALSDEGDFPDRRFDVSQLGYVFVSKAETKSQAKAEKMAKGLIKYWNDYLSGNVYGFVNGEDGEAGTCFGFYGDYTAKGGVVEQARAEVDAYVKTALSKEIKRHQKRRAELLADVVKQNQLIAKLAE